MTPAYTDPVFLSSLALCAFAAMTCLALAGGPFLALTGELLATARKRSFYDKFGKQMAAMSFRLLCCLLLSLAALLGYAVYLGMAPETMLASAQQSPAALAGLGALVGFLVFSALHFFTWKAMKKRKSAHKLLGFLSVLAALALLAAAVGAGRLVFHMVAQFPEITPLQGNLSRLFTPHPLSPVLPLAGQALLLALSTAGGLGCIYLLLRRTTEDFGRDYYVFAMGHAARWAWIPALLQLAPLGWLGWLLLQRLGGFEQARVELFFLAGAGAAYIAAVGLWAWVAKSATPLRLKPAIILAALLLGLAMTAQGYPLVQSLQSIPAPAPHF